MTENYKNETSELTCSAFSKGLGQKLTFLMLGGGIGAAIALLFAPKPGGELRQDIADAAVKSYEETLNAANRARGHAGEYFVSAKEKGSEMIDVVAETASALKGELKEDAARIGGIVTGATDRLSHSVRTDQVF